MPSLDCNKERHTTMAKKTPAQTQDPQPPQTEQTAPARQTQNQPARSPKLSPAQETKAKVDRIRQVMMRSESQISLALPNQMDAQRFMRIVMTSLQRTPKLLNVSPVRLIAAAMEAAQLGLEPDPRLGLCYLVPFKDDVQLILGFRGIMTLARRSGEIGSIEARPVHQNDVFEYNFGLTQRLHHVPAESQPGKLRAAYAIARFRGDAEPLVGVVLPHDVEKARKFSQSSARSDSPWKLHPSAMWAKTAVRRLEPYLPLSVDARAAMDLDRQAERGESQTFALDGILTDGEESNGQSELDALAESFG